MLPRTDRLLLANAMLGQFITGFAGRSFVVGMPTIANALDSTILGISWAIIAYQLASISLSVVFGRLGDIHGRYAIYGLGYVIMTLSAFFCGMAPNVVWLIGFRLLAGIGAAMISSATRVLAMEAMPEDAAGRANGFMTMSFHGGVLLGPPIGGFVIDVMSWRWIFLLMVPIGLTGIVLTTLRARAARPARAVNRPPIDYIGALLLVALTIVLTLLVDRRGAEMIGIGHREVLGAVFAAGLVGFLVHERRSANPVVNLALFKLRMFTFSVVSLLCTATTMSILMLLLPFYLQDVLHHSPSFMGVLFLAAPIFTVSLAPFVGRLTDRVGPRLPASGGVLMMVLAFAVGIVLRVDSHWALPALLMALTGLGQGFFNTANQTALITAVPREYRGFATGMVQMVFGLGSLLGTSLGSLLLTLMFRYASGTPDVMPTPEEPVPFVLAMNATYAVCVVLTIVAFTTSVMRGGGRTAISP